MAGTYQTGGEKKRPAGSDTPSESAVLFYLCVIIQFDDN